MAVYLLPKSNLALVALNQPPNFYRTTQPPILSRNHLLPAAEDGDQAGWHSGACTPETSPELAQHVWDPVTGPSWAPTTPRMPSHLSLLLWRGAPWTTLRLSPPHSLVHGSKASPAAVHLYPSPPCSHPCESPENTREETDTQAAGGPTVWSRPR